MGLWLNNSFSLVDLLAYFFNIKEIKVGIKGHNSYSGRRSFAWFFYHKRHIRYKKGIYNLNRNLSVYR